MAERPAADVLRQYLWNVLGLKERPKNNRLQGERQVESG